MNTEIFEFVLSVLLKEFNLKIDPTAINRETTLGSDGLSLESLTFVELAFRLEDKYAIEIPEDDIEVIAGFNTGQLIDYIETKVQKVAQGALSS